MKVLLISSEPYQHSESPLLGIFQKDQLNALTRIGVEGHVLSPAGRSLRHITKRIAKNNQPQQPYINYGTDWFPMFKSLQRYCYVKTGLKQFKAYVKDHGLPDIIHPHNCFNAGVLARVISHRYNLPYVITEHSSWIIRKDWEGKELKTLQDVYRNSNQIITVGESLSSSIKRLTRSDNLDIKVVGNILPEEFYTESEAHVETTKQNSNFNIITVGSLDENKNHELAIRAINHLVKSGCDKYHLTIIGSGPKRQFLNDLINELQIQSSVTLLGQLNRKDVKEHMKHADLLLITSFVETFGVVAIEANACGLPVISTPCGGTKGIIENSYNGVYLPSFDLESLVEVIRKTKDNYFNFESGNIQNMTKEKYSPEQIASNLLTIYKDVIENGNGKANSNN